MDDYKNDPYVYENTNVLRNLLNIQERKALEIAEAEISSANMMLLYENGFSDFSTNGVKEIHRAIFRDIYDWAGVFRIMNIMKRENTLAGKSVWYANASDIECDLDKAWVIINKIDWSSLDANEFAKNLAHSFPALWQAHPFRDGNTRTIVMMMTFFVEHHGFYFDQELFAASAGYVRKSFVLACWDEYSEYEHLERILIDTISDKPLPQVTSLDIAFAADRAEVYEKYSTEGYEPVPHEYRAADNGVG